MKRADNCCQASPCVYGLSRPRLLVGRDLHDEGEKVKRSRARLFNSLPNKETKGAEGSTMLLLHIDQPADALTKSMPYRPENVLPRLGGGGIVAGVLNHETSRPTKADQVAKCAELKGAKSDR
eukprot:g6147.t1